MFTYLYAIAAQISFNPPPPLFSQTTICHSASSCPLSEIPGLYFRHTYTHPSRKEQHTVVAQRKEKAHDIKHDQQHLAHTWKTSVLRSATPFP